MKNLDRQDRSDRKEALLALVDAGRRIHDAVDQVDNVIAERLGLHRSDLRCLNALEAGPLPPGEIGRRLGLTSGSVTAMVDRLERAGFVERRRSAVDRRSVEVAIPPAAFGTVGALYRRCAAALGEAFEGETAERIAAAASAVETFAAAYRVAAEELAGKVPPAEG